MLPRLWSTFFCLLVTVLWLPAVSGRLARGRGRGRRQGHRPKDPNLLTSGYLVLLDSEGVMMGCAGMLSSWETQGSCLRFTARYDPSAPPGSRQVILESSFAQRFCGIQREAQREPWDKRYFTCDFRYVAQEDDDPVPKRTPLALSRLQHGSTLYFENAARRMEASLFHLDPDGDGVRRLYVARTPDDTTVRAVWSSHPAPKLDLP